MPTTLLAWKALLIPALGFQLVADTSDGKWARDRNLIFIRPMTRESASHAPTCSRSAEKGNELWDTLTGRCVECKYIKPSLRAREAPKIDATEILPNLYMGG